LGFSNVAALDLTSLFAAAEGKLDWLLSRLQALVREERKFIHFSVLRDSVHQLYWIRT
jgi:hypothetical protein